MRPPLELLRTYPHFAAIWLLTFAGSLLLTGGAYVLAKRLNLLPAIRQKDIHTKPKPRVGGVAMWLAAVIAFLVIALGPQASLLQFGHTKLWGIDTALWGILSGMTVLLVVGLLDDIFDFTWQAQLASQFLAAVALVAFGVGINYIRLPFEHTLYLNTLIVQMPHWLGGGHLVVWSALFTIVWIMTIINVMNWFDGLDGLTGSISFTAALVLLLLSLNFGFTATATLSVVVSAVAAGFLPWNWYPSKIIMGTVGSQTLGFLLGVIAIISGGKLATAVLVLGIPFFDAIIVIARRLVDGVSPFKGDQRHLHHRLLKIGLPVPWAVILINAVAISFGALALSTQQATQKGLLTILVAVLMAVFIFITYALERRAERALR